MTIRVRFEVEYPERQLDRLTSFFRIFTVIILPGRGRRQHFSQEGGALMGKFRVITPSPAHWITVV